MADRTPPLTPTVLFVGDKRTVWQNPPIYRLTAVYATPTTVACEPVPKAADRDLWPQAGKKLITKHQHLLYPIRDDATWQRVVDQHVVLQQALDAFAAGLRAIGSYATRLAEAGGIKQAPNPLCPTVISCDDPDRDRTYYHLGNLVPSIRRLPIVAHTPKMLRAFHPRYNEPGEYEYTTGQDDRFVCPDDATWERIEALHGAAQAAFVAWQLLLDSELTPYNRANPERFASGESTLAQAPLAIAAPVALAGEILMSQAEARACVERIKGSLESVRTDLLALHDQEGYKALGYSTWRECVTAEFGQSQSYLYRQLAAAELERDLGFAIGETPESHLRPLTQLPTTEARRTALGRADELAGQQPRQAKHVEQAVREQQAPVPAAPAEPGLDATAIVNSIRKLLKGADQWAIGSDERHGLCRDATVLARELVDGPLWHQMMAEINAVDHAKADPEPLPPAPAQPGDTPWMSLAQSALRTLRTQLPNPADQTDQRRILALGLDLVAAMVLALNAPSQHMLPLIEHRLTQLRRPPTTSTAIAVTFLSTARDFDRRHIGGAAELLASFRAQPEKATGADLIALRDDIERASDVVDDASYDRLMTALTELEQHFSPVSA